MVTLQLRQLDIPPGQRLLLHDVGWDEFEAILTELGEHRGSRIEGRNKAMRAFREWISSRQGRGSYKDRFLIHH
jgi:hypothetical protein